LSFLNPYAADCVPGDVDHAATSETVLFDLRRITVVASTLLDSA
jgi:hypothetical protein